MQDARFPDILGVSAGGLVVDLTDGAHTQMSRLELELVLMEEGAPPDWMRPEVAAAHCSGAALAFRLHAELGLNFAFAARRGGRVRYRGRLQVSVGARPCASPPHRPSHTHPSFAARAGRRQMARDTTAREAGAPPRPRHGPPRARSRPPSTHMNQPIEGCPRGGTCAVVRRAKACAAPGASTYYST